MTDQTPEQTPEVDGQMALFDTDLNVTPEAQGFDPEPTADSETSPDADCDYCASNLFEQPSGRLTDISGSINCSKSPHGTHEAKS